MISKRIIPSLIIKNEELIHRSKFEETTERYVGDPINAINIFNNYFTDEIIILDIGASVNNEINYNLLKDLSSEAFTPLSYGGGIKSIQHAEKIISLGYEKIILNSACFKNLDLAFNCQKNLGAQSVIICVDIIKIKNDYFLYNHLENKIRKENIKEFLKKISSIEIGEVMLTSVSVDGLMTGCDFELIQNFQNFVNVPLIYRGGLSSLDNIKKVFETNVNAITSSSFFIMKKKDGGIVLNYPTREDKEKIC
jgi:imidazole glycerol-phosphate synthase subunit HisF